MVCRSQRFRKVYGKGTDRYRYRSYEAIHISLSVEARARNNSASLTDHRLPKSKAVELAQESMTAAAPWRNALLKSLELNKELKYSTFFQLATVRPNGKPANRTMVYRGFVGESTKLTFTTDSRSSKMEEVKENPWSEICWYMPESREQYRLSGKLYIIKSDEEDEQLKKIWRDAWSGLSTGGRGWFTWPDASQPRTDDDKEFEQEPPSQEEEPLSNYCLCFLDVYECELSKLREKLRIEYHSSEEDGRRLWTQRNMNP